jgi:hypothetical protein
MTVFEQCAESRRLSALHGGKAAMNKIGANYTLAGSAS